MVKTLSVIVVGGGLGGLATAIALKRAGHKVTVLEGAKQLSEVGAGIQVPPNTSRILDAWGLLDRFKTKVVWPGNINMRRYSTGEIIGSTPLKPKMIERYGYPYLLIHRADYLQLLYDHSVELGIEVVLGARVDSVDDDAVAVRLSNGSVYTGNMIIGADGIRSNVRAAVIPDETILPKKSTNCAYRATVPVDIMRSDPEIAHLMDDLNSNCWIGYRRHIMAYPMRGGELYNLVMSHPGEAAVGKWNEPGNLDEMKYHYRNFDPVIRKVLTHVTGCLKWTLADLPVLSHWVSPSGRVVLIGDAAHAMLPYLAQGAAQAIEDGATLGVLFSQIESVDEIPDLLKLYEKIRRPRAEKIQKGALDNGDIWHMPDGDDQIARDKAMKIVVSDDTVQKVHVKNPNQWSDGDFQPWLFGHDAIQVARKALNDKKNGYNSSSLEERASL
ncbi:salicylate hydroxylase [Mucor ambiguus]|uniref:Salicylate hydroxylase n=1 Tax=Mucor ambiguus TaxID=91626 RepID=A0A0C9MUS5_9FUNG|nr:salicylate hydroxylase [Mucor ambiguus]